MEAIYALGGGFAAAIEPQTLFATVLGAFLGTLVGILPGLGSPAAVALLLPLSFAMSPISAIAMLAGVWYGSSFGGIITAVLLNMPGEGDSVIATLDGNKMARQGRGGVALGISAIGGFIAGTIALAAFMFIGPSAANISLLFGPPEFFTLMLMGLSLILWLSGADLAKGLLSAALGLIVGFVGIDLGSGSPRLTFESVYMLSGIDFVPVVVGLFGLSEVLATFGSHEPGPVSRAWIGLKSLLPDSRDEWRRSLVSIFRGTGIGFAIGLIPGAGPTVSTFVAYAVEKKVGQNPETFGTGRIEGVASPEAANNSATIAGMVPLLALGLPASSTAAVLMGGFLIHGLVPGPLLFQDNADFVWGLIASLYIGNVFLLVLNTALIPLLLSILALVRGMLPAIVGLLVIIGAYALRSSIFDVWIAVIFGFIGLGFRVSGVPLAPMVIALVLGSKAEIAFSQSLSLSEGDLSIFMTRPGAATMLTVSLAILFSPLIGRAIAPLRRRRDLPSSHSGGQGT